MSDLNILIVEGNDPKNSEVFKRAAKATCAENIKKLVVELEPSSNIKIINPNKDNETKDALENMGNFHGIIFNLFCNLLD